MLFGYASRLIALTICITFIWIPKTVMQMVCAMSL